MGEVCGRCSCPIKPQNTGHGRPARVTVIASTSVKFSCQRLCPGTQRLHYSSWSFTSRALTRPASCTAVPAATTLATYRYSRFAPHRILSREMTDLCLGCCWCVAWHYISRPQSQPPLHDLLSAPTCARDGAERRGPSRGFSGRCGRPFHGTFGGVPRLPSQRERGEVGGKAGKASHLRPGQLFPCFVRRCHQQ